MRRCSHVPSGRANDTWERERYGERGGKEGGREGVLKMEMIDSLLSEREMYLFFVPLTSINTFALFFCTGGGRGGREGGRGARRFHHRLRFRLWEGPCVGPGRTEPGGMEGGREGGREEEVEGVCGVSFGGGTGDVGGRGTGSSEGR